jgi:hypothetical protein
MINTAALPLPLLAFAVEPGVDPVILAINRFTSAAVDGTSA